MPVGAQSGGLQTWQSLLLCSQRGNITNFLLLEHTFPTVAAAHAFCWENGILSIRGAAWKQPHKYWEFIWFKEERRAGSHLTRLLSAPPPLIQAHFSPDWAGFYIRVGSGKHSTWASRGRVFQMPELCLVKTGKHPNSWLVQGGESLTTPSPPCLFLPLRGASKIF